MSPSLYPCHEPFDFEQSSWVWSTPGKRHLRSDHHQWRNNIPHGPWSWYLHRFKHQFDWLRSQAYNEDVLFQIRQFRSIRQLLTIEFSHTLRDGYDFSWLLQRTSWWETMQSVSSVRYLASQKRTVPQWLDISAKIVFKICELAHPCLHGSAPPYIWYLSPLSAIPGRTIAHLRSDAVGMLKYSGLGHRLWQSDPGHFAISSPSAWNFLQVHLCDPGFSFITLRWKLKAFLFCPSAYLSVHQMLIIVFMFVNSRRLLFETIFNSLLILIIITIL